MVRTVAASKYLTPLREGGSLPAIVQADDGELYVMKFVGAGHGAKALIAEWVAGEIGRRLGLNVPEIVFIELDPALGLSEPDEEIHDLLGASAGLNLGLRYLPNAFSYNPLLQPPPAAELASAIVWFDALVANVDRTPQNVNMLVWQNDLWLIDHGSSLYVHHNWSDLQARARTGFPLIKHHTLLPFAATLGATDALLRHKLNQDVFTKIVDLIPDVWLQPDPAFPTLAAQRQAYVDYLNNRLAASASFTQEAEHARAALV